MWIFDARNGDPRRFLIQIQRTNNANPQTRTIQANKRMIILLMVCSSCTHTFKFRFDVPLADSVVHRVEREHVFVVSCCIDTDIQLGNNVSVWKNMVLVNNHVVVKETSLRYIQRFLTKNIIILTRVAGFHFANTQNKTQNTIIVYFYMLNVLMNIFWFDAYMVTIIATPGWLKVWQMTVYILF